MNPALPWERYEIFSYAAEPRSHALGTSNVDGVFAHTGIQADTQVDLANTFPLGYQFSTRQWDHSRQFNESAAKNSYYWNTMMKKMGLGAWYDRTAIRAREIRVLRWILITLLLCGGLLFLLWPLVARWIDKQHGVVPIVLYGRVTDENGNPLKGVLMAAEVRRVAWLTNPMAPQYTKVYLSATTDEPGRFSFESEGIDLSITRMDKEGWTDLLAPKYFTYPVGNGNSAQPNLPRPDDPDKPVQYIMRRTR